MALSGVREMSPIATLPVDRPVRTLWPRMVVREAIKREMFRGGQVFCVCPRTADLQPVFDMAVLVPEARISRRGKTGKRARCDDPLADGEADILLSTIVEPA